MSVSLDRLTREVSESRDAVGSVKTLIAGLSQQIRDLSDDPAALEALADDLDSQQADLLSEAVVENTPSAGRPPQPPVADEPAPATDEA